MIFEANGRLRSLCLGATTLAATLGCGSDPTITPNQQSQVRAGFHQKPDINKVTDPKMKKWIQGMIDSSKAGQTHDVTPPKSAG